MSELVQCLEQAAPYYGLTDAIPADQLDRVTQGVIDASGAAHQALYDGSERTVVIDDPDSDKTDQYVSFADQDGESCYFRWQPLNSATDIGVRGANPAHTGDINRTTILHADAGALWSLAERGAPQVALEAIDALVQYRNLLVEKVAIPYLTQVAEAYGIDPQKYLERFYPREGRARTIARAILYHTDTGSGARLVGSDGQELDLKGHEDKCTFTVDPLLHGGLEYPASDVWKSAGRGIAIFRGAGEDGLGIIPGVSLTPPMTHRVVHTETSNEQVSRLPAGIGRAALPIFIAISEPDASFVPANLSPTHPMLVATGS